MPASVLVRLAVDSGGAAAVAGPPGRSGAPPAIWCIGRGGEDRGRQAPDVRRGLGDGEHRGGPGHAARHAPERPSHPGRLSLESGPGRGLRPDDRAARLRETVMGLDRLEAALAIHEEVQAAGQAAGRPVEAVESFITNPSETRQGTPSGVSRLFDGVELGAQRITQAAPIRPRPNRSARRRPPGASGAPPSRRSASNRCSANSRRGRVSIPTRPTRCWAGSSRTWPGSRSRAGWA